MNNLSFKI